MTPRAICQVILSGALALALPATAVLAQSSGGSSGSSGGASGSSGGAAGSGGATAPGASGGGSGTDAAGARSRAMRQQGTSGTGTSGTAAPNPALNSNPAAPGQSAVPSPSPGSGQSATPGRAGGAGDLNTPQQGQAGARATNRGGTPDPTPNTQVQPNSPSDQSKTGQQGGLTGGGSARREGAAGHDMKTCMDAWDAGTHMTKAQWRRVCSNTLSDRRSILR